MIDVRDDDFRGGNIAGALNHPSLTYSPSAYEELAKELTDQGVDKVVFHCMLSQVRYVRSASFARKASASRREGRERTSSPLRFVLVARGPKAASRYAQALHAVDPSSSQEVLILNEGFQGFQKVYKVSREEVPGGGRERAEQADRARLGFGGVGTERPETGGEVHQGALGVRASEDERGNEGRARQAIWNFDVPF